MTFNSAEARKQLLLHPALASKKKDYIIETMSHAQTTLVLEHIKRENDVLDQPHTLGK